MIEILRLYLLASLLATPCLASSTIIKISSDTIQDPYQLVGSTKAPTSELSKVPWFPELLEYEIHWGIISVGQANLRTSQVEDFNGTPAVRIVSEATSNGFCDTFYKVRDLNESWLQANDFYSLGYSKHLREGSFYRNEWVLYDYLEKIYLSKTTNRDGTFYYKQGSIPGLVQDILSSLYYIRTKNLKVGEDITLDANTKDNWPLLIKVLSEKNVEVPAGKFDVVVVEPVLRHEGIFVRKSKRLEVWMTNDERHIPVYMRAEVGFGHVTAKLVRINAWPEGPGGKAAPSSAPPN